MAKILVIGGLYWSHTCVELLNLGHEVAVLDNLSNNSEQSLNRVQALKEKLQLLLKAIFVMHKFSIKLFSNMQLIQ